MISVTFVDHRGIRRDVTAETGVSLMIAARANGIDAITADCGGVGACATCQIYVDEFWTGRAGAPSQDELDMLELTNGLRGNSRLSCQIILDETLDGLVVTTPEIQT